MWYLRPRNRFFLADVLLQGDGFIYAAQIAIVLILLLGHPGAGILQVLPTFVLPYLLIAVSAYTVYHLNRQFVEQKAFELDEKRNDLVDKLRKDNKMFNQNLK